MTAQIILFPRRFLSRSSQLPSAIEVALEHIIWLRAAYPGIAAETAAQMIDRHANTWADVVNAYADAWQNLPEEVRLRRR